MFVILKLFFFFGMVGKILLHIYIGYNNKSPIIHSGSGVSIEVLWFYTKPVSDEYLTKKKICNYLQWFNMFVLIIVIIYGLLAT